MRSPARKIAIQRPPLVAPRLVPGGFTLIEMLVTVGIIALLFGLSMVGIAHARKSAQRTRVQSDLEMIRMALEQYKKDFGDYPRFADPQADLATQGVAGNGTWLDYSPDRGARLLCQALIAPGPATSSNPSVPDGQDGADGPGFRVRRSSMGGTVVLGGHVYGPYLHADKFKLEFNAVQFPNMQDAKILDITGNPILYYPALPGPPAVALPGGFVTNSNPQSPQATKPLYNGFDNTIDTTTGKPLLGAAEMAYLLGDTNQNGTIDNGESAVTTGPYLLWTAGPDGIFGRLNGKTDDIANFDFPPGVRK